MSYNFDIGSLIDEAKAELRDATTGVAQAADTLNELAEKPSSGVGFYVPGKVLGDLRRALREWEAKKDNLKKLEAQFREMHK